MCTLRSFKHRVQRRPLFLIQQRFHAILVELSPTPCAYSHSCVSPRSQPGAGLTIDFLSSFLFFFFRFLEFSLERENPVLPREAAKYLRKQPRTTRNGSFRFTTRILVKRRVLGKRANLGILTLSPPPRWTDRFYPDCKLLRGEVIQHRGRPTCSTRYPKNARLDIKFASRMIRDRYDFTEEEKRSLHRFSMHLLSLSLPSRRPFSRFRASTLLPLT